MHRGTAIYSEELYQVKMPMVVAIDRAWEKVNGADRQLLGKILAAVKQSLASVRIVHTTVLNVNTFPEGSSIIAFGVLVNPEIPPYQLASVGETRCIRADFLSDLDDVRKKCLWTAMKGGFA